MSTANFFTEWDQAAVDLETQLVEHEAKAEAMRALREEMFNPKPLDLSEPADLKALHERVAKSSALTTQWVGMVSTFTGSLTSVMGLINRIGALRSTLNATAAQITFATAADADALAASIKLFKGFGERAERLRGYEKRAGDIIRG